MSTVTEMRANPKDTLEQFGPNVFAEAYKRGMSVSAYLESQDPSTAHDDGLDAFQRVVREAGVRTTGLDDIGMPASSWEHRVGGAAVAGGQHRPALPHPRPVQQRRSGQHRRQSRGLRHRAALQPGHAGHPGPRADCHQYRD